MPSDAAGPTMLGSGVGDPKLAGVAGNHTAAAAREAAGAGAAFVKKEFLEVRAYIQESHCTLKILCFCNALALLVSSILGMINVFGAIFKPWQFLFAVYNLFFAA